MKKKRQYAYDNSSLAMRRYRAARAGLVGMMLLTVVNTVMAAIGEYESYFVFSDYLAYYCAVYGRVFYEQSGEMLYLILGCAAAALILLPYLLCWIFSKKRRGWLIAALVLFTIDTLLVIWDAIGFMDISYLMDIGFHIWLLVELVLGIRAGKKALAEANAPQVAADTEFHDGSTGEQPDTPALGMPQEERKHRVLLTTEHGGDTIEVRRSYSLSELVINGRLYDRREGVREGAYVLSARVKGKLIEAKQLPGGLLTIEVNGQLVDEKLRLI